ncbi:hypothetical protein BKA69DRAFT_284076 [Paraphysoderma sedebokerense]|nr:hypothetical protein BKA69DRAFT_284076 [Paraphysoderma sedebokerense]
MPVQQHPDWHLPAEFFPFNDAIIGLGVISVSFKILLFIQIWRKRQYVGVSTASSIHICFLDFLSGWYGIIINSAHHISSTLPWIMCQIDGISLTLLVGASFQTLFILSIERYLHIVRGKPATPREITLMLASVWFFSIITAFAPILAGTYYVPQPQMIYCLNDYTQRTRGHLIYSITTLSAVVSGNVGVTWIYYSIYRKAISDGFKWNTQSFVIKSVVSRYLDSKSNVQNSDRSLVIWAENDTDKDEKDAAKRKPDTREHEIAMKKNEAYKKQIEFTVKLAIFTFYAYFCWFGITASWIYQLITGNKVPPAIDFAVTLIPFCGGIMHPIIVLNIDNRFRFEKPL